MIVRRGTYGGILGSFRVAALERETVTLVLQTLGRDQALDLGGLGVGLLAFTLWLDLATDNKLANLYSPRGADHQTQSFM